MTALPRLEHADFTATVRLLEREGEARRRAVLDEAAARLDDADDGRFAELYALLERLGGWERPRVSDDAWLRWIGAAMPAPPGENQENGVGPRSATPGDGGAGYTAGVAAYVAGQLAAAPDLAGDPRAVAMLSRLLGSPNPADRLAALPVAVGFIPLRPRPTRQWCGRWRMTPTPAVADDVDRGCAAV